MYDPAQRQLVNQLIDWATVERRLKQFPAIARAFPLNRLKMSSGTPPYHCHYMAWRLGTWSNEALFGRLDNLLTEAEKLPNWSSEASLLKDTEFAVLWSLVWQLQVAEHLCRIGSDVSWGASGGPDLSVDVEGERWFVECYAYRKSFGLLLFIEEVLRQVDPSLRVVYDLCRPFSLPADGKRSAFLHWILSPFLNPQFVEDARSRSEDAYPVVLRQHESGLAVYFEGSDPHNYLPGVIPHQTGDPQRYLKVALGETIKAKKSANKLATHHPNLVAANFALSTDFQLALDRADDLGLPLPATGLGPNIDALAIAAAGIDERLERCRLRVVAVSSSAGPGLHRLACAT